MTGINTSRGLYKIRKSEMPAINIGGIFDWETLVDKASEAGYETKTYVDNFYAYNKNGDVKIVADKQRAHVRNEETKSKRCFFPEELPNGKFQPVQFITNYEGKGPRAEPFHMISHDTLEQCKGFCDTLNEFIKVSKKEATVIAAQVYKEIQLKMKNDKVKSIAV